MENMHIHLHLQTTFEHGAVGGGNRIIIIYFNCKWAFTRRQWYYNKTQPHPSVCMFTRNPTRPDLLNFSVFMHVCLSMALQPFVGRSRLLQFGNLFTQTVGLLGRVISPSKGPYLHTGQHKHRINAHRHPFL
jgi:hypothetical protein